MAEGVSIFTRSPPFATYRKWQRLQYVVGFTSSPLIAALRQNSRILYGEVYGNIDLFFRS
jgi:hypothetical protein